jgi:hypothetical protein
MKVRPDSDKSLVHIISWNEYETPALPFRSITKAVDTATSAGQWSCKCLAASPKFERSMVRERTRAGLGPRAIVALKVGQPPN